MKNARTLAAIGVLSVCAMGVLPIAGAQAAGNLTAACQFRATSVAPSPPTWYLGGSGTFTFSGPGNCAGRNGTQEVLLEGINVSGSGSYSSVACGTGTAGPVSVTVKQGANVIATATINLSFVAGNGVINPTTSTFTGGPSNATNDANLGGGTVTLTDDSAGPVVAPSVSIGPPTQVNLNNNGAVTGYVHISPTPLGNSPDPPSTSLPGLGNCVTRFDLVGAVVVDSIV